MKTIRQILTISVLFAVALPIGLSAAEKIVVGEMFTNTG